MDALPFLDFLFGNETEAGALATSEGWEGEALPEVAKRVSVGP